MKKLFITTLFATSVLTGCTSNDEAGDLLDRSINDDTEYEAPTDEDNELSSQLGYVHYTNDDFIKEEDQDRFVAMDRNQMADTISRLLLRYDGFEEVATLVTDREVLIAYEKPERLDREQAATIAKKTGLSILPRFYDVYVSDKDVSFRDIQSLQNSNTLRDDYQNTLENIIEDMKEAPQGEEVKDDNDNKYKHD